MSKLVVGDHVWLKARYSNTDFQGSKTWSSCLSSLNASV